MQMIIHHNMYQSLSRGIRALYCNNISVFFTHIRGSLRDYCDLYMIGTCRERYGEEEFIYPRLQVSNGIVIVIGTESVNLSPRILL